VLALKATLAALADGLSVHLISEAPHETNALRLGLLIPTCVVLYPSHLNNCKSDIRHRSIYAPVNPTIQMPGFCESDSSFSCCTLVHLPPFPPFSRHNLTQC